MAEKCVLFVDGENFLYKLEDVLKQELGKGREIVSIDFEKLLDHRLLPGKNLVSDVIKFVYGRPNIHGGERK